MTPEDSEALKKQVSSWKVMKPYLQANHPEFHRALPNKFGWYINKDLNETSDKSELCWAAQAASVLDFFREHTQGAGTLGDAR